MHTHTQTKKKQQRIGCPSRVRIDPVVFANNSVPGCEIWQYELTADHKCDNIILCNQEIKKSRRFLKITKEELRKVRDLRRENLKLELEHRQHEIKCARDERFAMRKEEAMVRRANKPKRKRRSKKKARGIPIKSRARTSSLDDKHKKLKNTLQSLKASQKKYDLRQRNLSQLDHDLAVAAGLNVPENE